MFPFTFLVLALLSEIVGTVAGFGSSVFFVPLAGLLLDFHEVLALTSILHVFSNTAKLVLFGRHVRWRLLLLLGIPSVLLVIVGAYLSAQLKFKFTELLLGIFLVSFGLLLLLMPRVKLSQNRATVITAGGLAGFFAGLIGTGGAIRGLALAAFHLEKGSFVATSAAIDFGAPPTFKYVCQGTDPTTGLVKISFPGYRSSCGDRDKADRCCQDALAMYEAILDVTEVAGSLVGAPPWATERGAWALAAGDYLGCMKGAGY
jgi:Sulfite exporter TauE/SafE